MPLVIIIINKVKKILERLNIDLITHIYPDHYLLNGAKM